MKDALVFSHAATGYMRWYLSYKEISCGISNNGWDTFRVLCKKRALGFLSGSCKDSGEFSQSLVEELGIFLNTYGVCRKDINSVLCTATLDGSLLKDGIVELSNRYLGGRTDLVSKSRNPRVNHDSLTKAVIGLFKSFIECSECKITVSDKEWSKLADMCKPRKIEWDPYNKDNYSLAYYHVWSMDIYVGNFVSFLSQKGYRFSKGVYDDLVPAIRTIIPNHVDWVSFCFK